MNNANFLIVFFEPSEPDVFYRIQWVTTTRTRRVVTRLPAMTSIYAVPFGGGTFKRVQ